MYRLIVHKLHYCFNNLRLLSSLYYRIKNCKLKDTRKLSNLKNV